MSLRRGFKSKANQISLRLRRGLGLEAHDPINLAVIAERMDVAIVPLSSFTVECPEAVAQLMEKDVSAFSAATIIVPPNKRVIIHNDGHYLVRQNSNLAHEISHILLGHQSTLPIDASGMRQVDRDIEDEANWLAAAILIPNEAALYIVRNSIDTKTACDLYGVSEALLRMRINASGAQIRVRREYH